MKMIPFSPVPLSVIQKITPNFRGYGDKISKKIPGLEENLYKAGMDIDAKEYGSIVFIITIFYFLFSAILIPILLSRFIFTNTNFFIGTNFISIPSSLIIGIAIAIVIAFLIFIQLIAFPVIQIKKRVRAIDSNLIYALRTMLVQIKSGVSLFNAISMVATSKRFGQLGVELSEAVDKINTGTQEQKAIEELARKNPSEYLRKALWQILNGMKAGADISDVLSETVKSIVREQEIEIQKYASSLRMLSLMYLMIGVILPALGITFLIVIGSFPRIEVSESLFWMMLGGLVLMEFMFMGIIKSKRPGLMGG